MHYVFCHNSSHLQALTALLYRVILCPVWSAVLHMPSAGSSLFIDMARRRQGKKKACPIFFVQLKTESVFFLLFLLPFLSHISIIVG